jgi:hypothetical protein
MPAGEVIAMAAAAANEMSLLFNFESPCAWFCVEIKPAYRILAAQWQTFGNRSQARGLVQSS